MANDGLSQEDFRKLLQTPRPGGDTFFTSTPKFKAPAPKAPRNEGSAVFAKPKSIKNKKKRIQGADDQDKLNYRDRAAERRVGENGPSNNQQTTEDLLRPMEQDETLDAQQVYEQSKYLGGDIQHTHLVKGLDFTLLNKVRRQIHETNSGGGDDDDDDDNMEQVDEMENGNNTKSAMAMDEQAEDALDDALDRLDRGEKAIDEGSASTKDVSRLSATAKALDNLFTYSERATGDNSSNINTASLGTSPTTPLVYELFRPGRMAFLFPAATTTSIDSFTIPTAVIRSKADINERQQQSSQASGWSDEALQESELVLSKVSQVMARSRQQQQIEQQKAKQLEEQRNNIKTMAAPQVSPPSPKNDMEDDDDDNLIFSDVEGDYVLDESTIEKQKQQEPPSDDAPATKHTNYFMDSDHDDNDATMDEPTETSAMVSEMMESTAANGGVGGQKRKYDLGAEENIDTDSQDMDMFGLSTSALPTSFTDRQRMTVMDDDDDDANNKDGGGGGDEKRSKRQQQATLLVDQGTHKNKKAQLSRWDFDDEEQWQHYKSTVEIQPKSAAQFGVKMGDGRKRNKERRGMSDKQKLNREYQQVKGIMDKKYVKS
ncbi:unnamed protein product [Absidia cylindrospora]